jgi:hypothetical protein
LINNLSILLRYSPTFSSTARMSMTSVITLLISLRFSLSLMGENWYHFWDPLGLWL